MSHLPSFMQVKVRNRSRDNRENRTSRCSASNPCATYMALRTRHAGYRDQTGGRRTALSVSTLRQRRHMN